MTRSQHVGNGSHSNQQIQTDGDVNAQTAAGGAIIIGGDNHGVVVTSLPTRDEPQYTFDIPKKTRIPTPASLIGTVSGLITIAGFATGAFSVKQIVDMIMSHAGFDIMNGPPPGYWWLLGSMLAIFIGLAGLSFFRFLRRNVLALPKWWIFRAWAGIKEENGKTYPYSLRLAMRCPRCKNKKLRFKQVPANVYDIIDLETLAQKGQIVTKWAPMAVCPRHEKHSIPVDISGNDFDEALPR